MIQSISFSFDKSSNVCFIFSTSSGIINFFIHLCPAVLIRSWSRAPDVSVSDVRVSEIVKTATFIEIKSNDVSKETVE